MSFQATFFQMIPIALIYISIRDLISKIIGRQSIVVDLYSNRELNKMNVIILGRNEGLRSSARHFLKSRLCPQSYTFHDKANLEHTAWLPTTKAVIVTDRYSDCFSGKDQYLSQGGIILDYYCEKEESILNHFRLSDHMQPRYEAGISYGPFKKIIRDTKCESSDKDYTPTFDYTKYFDLLKTELGETIYHYNTISSTMDYFNDANEWENIVVLADRQLNGKGRKKNEWISPNGSIAVSFGFALDLNAVEHLAAVQHIIAVSICKALSNSKGVRCKWPNDIYWNKVGFCSLIDLTNNYRMSNWADF